jgi:RNA polymerase sigma-70 factor (ECF subfamily)
MRRFTEALAQGDFAGMKSMLADAAVLMGDGGGLVTTFPEPMVGGQRIAQLFFAANLRNKDALRIELAMINGQYAVLRYINGELESAQSYESDGEHITRVYVQRNPEKLARLMAAVAQRRRQPSV